MGSVFVIKVQYGDTLRRFITWKGLVRLDLSMDELRAKIFSFFNFPPAADITMTYFDDDGETVTLADDADLVDITGQKLKFLKINVVLNSGSSTPMMSLRVQQPLPNVNAVVEALKSEPQPLHEGLSEISLDIFASKAASARSPGIAELFESFAKLGQSFLNPAAQSEGLRLELTMEDSKLILNLSH